jgi:hypothetical protein
MRAAPCAALLAALAACGAPPAKDGPVAGWPFYGGDAGGARWSPLTQITRANVGELEVAWTFHTGDRVDGKGAFEATPILFGDALYLCTLPARRHRGARSRRSTSRRARRAGRFRSARRAARRPSRSGSTSGCRAWAVRSRPRAVSPSSAQPSTATYAHTTSRPARSSGAITCRPAGRPTFRLRRESRQLVVIAAGGHGTLGTKQGDAVVAFALPER